MILQYGYAISIGFSRSCGCFHGFGMFWATASWMMERGMDSILSPDADVGRRNIVQCKQWVPASNARGKRKAKTVDESDGTSGTVKHPKSYLVQRNACNKCGRSNVCQSLDAAPIDTFLPLWRSPSKYSRLRKHGGVILRWFRQHSTQSRAEDKPNRPAPLMTRNTRRDNQEPCQVI